MPFDIGAHVVVRTLGNKRGIVMAAARNGRCQVQVEGLTVSCREEDLALPPARSKKQIAREKERMAPAATSADAPGRPGRVDLHGLTVEAAMTRVTDEIEQAIVRGADRVEVIHGKGSGRIRHALHRHLASMAVVSAFKLDAANPGVTWIYL
jgi:DNA mismatch repair protein MutS2